MRECITARRAPVLGGACFSLPSRREPAQFLRATKGDEDVLVGRSSACGGL